jgi:acyl-[acyl carrier protein]--UDP-N-acetylglucosamine O-acyltransferase
MRAKIHPAARVHPSTVLADSVEIGVYSVVEAEVQIGAGSVPNLTATAGSGNWQLRDRSKSYVKA